jgi:small-conductance mechanosensitive channel
MHDLTIGEHDLVSYLRPDSFVGAIGYLVLFVLAAMVLSRALRAAVHAAMTRSGHLDRTTLSFLQQMGSALIWVVLLILYAHLIPALRSMGTALLAGASVASVVIGLAAQSTLGNLVAGVSITIYRPFRLGDTLLVAAPTGTEVGVVELISLGYTTLRATDGHLIVLPNSIAASQVTINLNTTYAPGAIVILITLGRSADWEAARRLALEVARESVGGASVARGPTPVGSGRAAVGSGGAPVAADGAAVAGDGAPVAAGGAPAAGCYLTKVETGTVTLELRVANSDAAGREALRSTLLSELAKRFEATRTGVAGEVVPAFS